MKIFKRFILLLIVAGMIGTILSGCFIFRPKNRCGDCPSWNKQGH